MNFNSDFELFRSQFSRLEERIDRIESNCIQILSILQSSQLNQQSIVSNSSVRNEETPSTLSFGKKRVASLHRPSTTLFSSFAFPQDEQSNLNLLSYQSNNKNLQQSLLHQSIQTQNQNNQQNRRDKEEEKEKEKKEKEGERRNWIELQEEEKEETEEVRKKEEGIVINPQRKETEGEKRMGKELNGVLLPHQIEGIRFLWENIVYMKGMEGCLLADSMGLGKTLQTIALLSTLFHYQLVFTVLLVVPSSVIPNWELEFAKWISPSRRPNLFPFLGKTSFEMRIEYLKEWQKEGGVLLISFEMFRHLTFQSLNDSDTNHIAQYKQHLCNPGADLVVVDEGHKISNPSSNITESLKSIKTTKRIALTGYPLQNRLAEYWCMIDFLRPNYLGLNLSDFRQMFETPISNGLCADSRPSDVQLAKRRMYVLTRLLQPFTKRRDFSCLKDSLPTKYEFVIGTTLSPFQKNLYNTFLQHRMKYFGKEAPHAELLAAQHIFLKIINHPDVIKASFVKNKEIQEQYVKQLDVNSNSLDKSTELNGEEDTAGIDYSWLEDVMKDYEEGILENGPKMLILLELISLCQKKGEKVLVFSQSVQTLNVIEKFIKKKNAMKDPICHYCRIDGATPLLERQRQIDLFNGKHSKELVFLLSTRAGGLGINLTGASRVILYDTSWNPSHDIESIYRAYRFGQTKQVYVYRLIASGTIESRIYDRQIIKQGLFRNVVDEKNPRRTIPKVLTRDLLRLDSVDSFSSVEEAKQAVEENDSSKDPVLSQLFGRNYRHLNQVYQHESLLEEDALDGISDYDRRKVDEFIKKETIFSTETWKRMVLMENQQLNVRYDVHGNSHFEVKSNVWSKRMDKTVENMLGEAKHDGNIVECDDLEYFGYGEEGNSLFDSNSFDSTDFQTNERLESSLCSNTAPKFKPNIKSFAPIINKSTTTLSTEELLTSQPKRKSKEDKESARKKVKGNNDISNISPKDNGKDTSENVNNRNNSNQKKGKKKERKGRSQICKYFYSKGGCNRDNCSFSHDPHDFSVTASKKRPCKYFHLQNSCWSEDCFYSHDVPLSPSSQDYLSLLQKVE